MFFSLSLTADPSFPHYYSLGRLTLNTDIGWRTLTVGSRTLVFKGYAESAELDAVVLDIRDNEIMGNFCVFDYNSYSGITEMKTSRYRSFRPYHNGQCFTNLYTEGRPIWADTTVALDQDLVCNEQKIDAIGLVSLESITRDVLVKTVHEILSKRVQSFIKNNTLPIKVFLSGGIDSMLVFSYIKSHTDRFQIIFGNQIEWDEFWCRNAKKITEQFWGYRQIHHWLRPCVLSSGTPGDEFMLRSPTTADLWLRCQGTSLLDQLTSPHGRDHLHSGYFQLPKNVEIFEKHKTDQYHDRQKWYWQMCNIVINDAQHWHLGNTLTFTLLRDLDIFKLFLRLPLTDALDQIMDSNISKQLIALNDASLLDYISDEKNVGENYANLSELMSKYSATSGQ